MGKIKDNFYNWVVKKDENVKYEYERYVIEHTVEHYEHRFLHWKVLWKLCWHYRVKKKTSPMLYFDKVQKYENGGTKENRESKHVKLPYLKGAESALLKRSQPHLYVKQFANYDVISFDIFDTLIFRKVADPTAVFMFVGQRLGICDFYGIRKEAEQDAKALHFAKYGNREVTIDEIYALIEKRTGICAEQGIRTECEVEKDLCFANPYMHRVFCLLKEQGKILVATSDMYMHHCFIESLLVDNGYAGLSEIIISNEYSCDKKEGELFEVLKKKYAFHSIAHIGDNTKGDYQKAIEHGLKGILYKNINEFGNQYRADGMGMLIGNAYAGIVNAHLHNGLNTFSPQYEFGYINGGIYVLGFCSFINKFCIENHVDKILFLSRDGYIYQKIYRKFFGDINDEYVYWSRIASAMISVRNNRVLFMENFLYQKARYALEQCCLGTLLDKLGLSDLKPYLVQYNLHEDTILCKETEKCVEELFDEHWTEIVAVMDRKTKEISAYLASVIGNAKKVAIIDVGWTGKNVMCMKEIIKKEINPSCQVECLLAAFRSATNQALEISDEIHPYLFSYEYNRDMYDCHANGNKYPMNSLFEIMTQAPFPSFIGIEGGEYIFDLPEVENYSSIKEIDAGIMDFCQQYVEGFAKEAYMLNIQGRDAFAPYRMHIRNLSFFRKHFGDFMISLNTLSSSDEKIETIQQILSVPRK